MQDKYSKFKIYGNEVRFNYCPICGKEKSNPDFSVNLKTGKYYCHTQGVGGKIDNLVDKSFLEKIPKVTKKNKSNTNRVNLSEFMKSKASCYLGSDWLQYLQNRGISERYLNTFCRLGKNNSMMIPVTSGTEVVGIKYRTMDKKLTSESGSDFTFFMNWQNITDFSYLIIVEGEMDLLSAIEVGYVNTVSLPSGTSNLKCIDNQIKWIGKFQKIIIAVDSDEPGQKAKLNILEKLTAFQNKIYEVDMGEYKDFNEVLVNEGSERLSRIIKEATKVGNVFTPFYREEDGYYVMQKENYKRVTDFTVDIKGYSDNFIVGTVFSNGREREFKAKKVDLITKPGMLENLGYFLGSTQSIPTFWSWMLDENKEEYLQEIPHYGIIDEKYYDQNSRVICGKEDLKIQQLEEIEDLTDEQLQWLQNKLIYLRADTNQSLLGICWALGRLHNNDGSYPLLEVAGTTSIGKTEYVEFIIRILLGTRENIKSFTTLSNHQIRSLSSCSNITPWVIDEVKIAGRNLKERAMDLYSTIRAVYDNKTVNQGNITSKLTEFKLCSPLIISGETELSDVSIKNRMISTKLTKLNKSEDEVYFTLKNTKILEQFGKVALKNRINNGKIEITLKEAREILREVKDDRQLYNGKCLLTGLKALTQIIKIEDKVIVEFIDALNKLLSHEYNVIQNFLELLELVAQAGERTDHFYQIKDGKHYVRFNLLYKAIAAEHEKTNSTLELLDMRTLKKQLIEEKFIINSRVSVQFKKSNFTNEFESYKADEIQKNEIFK